MDQVRIDTDKILRAIGENASEKFMLQIGAMDGVSFDDIRGYTDLFKWSGLYVEPNPEMYQRMVDSYKGRDNVKFEMSAISDYDGDITMLRIPPDVVDSGKVHACFNGMTSVWPPRNGLGSEGDKPTVEKYGEKITVPCITLKNLLAKHDVNTIDILAIDAEGHDWTIFSQFNFDLYRPSYIKIEYINLDEEEKNQLKEKLTEADYVYQIQGQDINAIPKELHQPAQETKIKPTSMKMDNITIVTGIWDLNRDQAGEGFKRNFDFYIDNFRKLLKIKVPMVIYIEHQYHSLVKAERSGMEAITDIRIKEVSDFRKMEFYDKIQSIRKNQNWLNQAEWLSRSSQATMEMYNPMVMSKMFMLNDARIWNPFSTEYMAWIDGGITNTVHEGYFSHDNVFDKVTHDMDKFFFISFPYRGNTEIHGFPRDSINQYCEVDYVDYVCRGGFFGGHINTIAEANGHYYSVLSSTLNDGYMGTEESVFTIMSHQQPEKYNRYMIKDDGLISYYFEHVKNNDVKLVKPAPKVDNNPLQLDLNNISTALYVITFNSPKQFEALIKSYLTQPGFISDTVNYVINNSTDRSTDSEYDRLCEEYNFTQIKRDNIGICGGRQLAAEHFDQTDHDMYIFLEDDMMLKTKKDTCKCGFDSHVDNLFSNVQRILVQEGYDFLKFSFAEFYGDNHTQWAWYNVPNEFRIKHWPNNARLPRQGLSKDAPKVKYNSIKSLNGLPYADGHVYYCNWPQIVSRPGNKKMFLDTKWNHPHEQTWMSHMYQMSVNGELNTAVLLASPINHDRFDHYDFELRVES